MRTLEREAAQKRKSREESLEKLRVEFRNKKMEGPTVACASSNRLWEPSKMSYEPYDNLKALGMYLPDNVVKESNDTARKHLKEKEQIDMIEGELEKLRVEQIETEASGKVWKGKVFGGGHHECKLVTFEGEEYCLSEYLTWCSTRLFSPIHEEDEDYD